MQEKVFFENSKGDRLCGVLSNPGDVESPIIVLCHGFTSSKEGNTYHALEKELNSAGVATFRFDFYGHGESSGKFEDITVHEAVDDALCAIAFVKQKGFTKIGLMGSSFGGNAALLAAAKSPGLFVLALKAPVGDYKGRLIGIKTLEQWKEDGFTNYNKGDGTVLRVNYGFYEDAESIDSYEEFKKIAMPTLIVHGDADKAVSCEQSKKSASVIKKCQLEIIPGAGHRFDEGDSFQKMLTLIVNFILAHV